MVFHHALLHTGTENRSAQTRLFCCVTYTMAWIKHRAHFEGPVCQGLVAQARRRGDRRFVRLLGADERAIHRVLHDAVLEPEAVVWDRWRQEDLTMRAAAAGTSPP